MINYKDYTIEITMKSPLGTDFQSDTIFGHICWAIRYLTWKSKDYLNEFLAEYEKQNPPLILSGGFPKGYLPKPIIPTPTQKNLDELIGRDVRIYNAVKIKTIKEMKVIPKQAFINLQKGRVTPISLFQTLLNHYDNILSDMRKSQTEITEHNAINRIRRQTTGLFSQEDIFFKDDGACFEIYVRTSFFQKQELNQIFSFIKEQGFGRDKSTGKGHFDFEIIEGDTLPESENPNAFMTLSSYVPDANSPTKGHYNLIHKYGKLGGAYAKGILNKNPFKVPILMFAPGSTFYDDFYNPGKTYGSLLENVHHNNMIKHYAYAFPLGITL